MEFVSSALTQKILMYLDYMIHYKICADLIHTNIKEPLNYKLWSDWLHLKSYDRDALTQKILFWVNADDADS